MHDALLFIFNFKSFLFWVIFITYNTGIYICIYNYKVSYIHSFFVILNCNVFSALHAEHFDIWKNVLWNWWVDCFIARSIHQVMRYFWVFIVNPFSLVWSFFFSRKLRFLWSPCLLLIAESISLDASDKPSDKPKVWFFLNITSPFWITLSRSLDELNLKVHKCRFENLPIYSISYKSNTLKNMHSVY